MSRCVVSPGTLLLVWLGLAVFPFAAAGYLTQRIVYVNHHEFDPDRTPVQEIGIYGSNPDVVPDAVVNYIYSEGSAQAVVEIDADFSNDMILNHVAGPNACYDTLQRKTIPITRIYPQDGPDDDTYLIAQPQAPYGPTVFFQISCKLKAIVEPETYTERRIHFQNLGYEITYSPPDRKHVSRDAPVEPFPIRGEPFKWTLTLQKSSSIENVVFLGKANSEHYGYGRDAASERWTTRELGATRDFAPEDIAEVHWESLTMQSWRDVWIVIIGTLVAVGAAMIVEAVRPFVDRLAETRTVTSVRERTHASAEGATPVEPHPPNTPVQPPSIPPDKSRSDSEGPLESPPTKPTAG